MSLSKQITKAQQEIHKYTNAGERLNHLVEDMYTRWGDECEDAELFSRMVNNSLSANKPLNLNSAMPHQVEALVKVYITSACNKHKKPSELFKCVVDEGHREIFNVCGIKTDLTNLYWTWFDVILPAMRQHNFELQEQVRKLQESVREKELKRQINARK